MPLPWPVAGILATLLGTLLAGCATNAPARPGVTARSVAALRAESLRKMDPVRIQADTMGFSDRFVAAMSDAYDELEASAPTAAARDAAHRLKTDMALSAIGNAVNPRPIAGMMDMVAMVTLLREIAADPWTARTFGAKTGPLTDRLAQLDRDVRTLAAKYLTDRQLGEITEVVAEWRRAHPEERYVSHLHLADLPAANLPPELAERNPGSVFGLMFMDLTADLDPAVREVELMRAASERMFYYGQRLPLLLQWQVEGSLRGAVASPEFVRVADNVAAVAAGSTRFAGVGERFAAAVERLPEQLAAERQAAIGALSAEVSRQRTEGVAVLAAAVKAEREAAVSEAAATFRREQRNFVNDSEAATTRSLDRMTWRLALLVLLLLGTHTLAAMYLARHRRAWRRRGWSGRGRATRPRAGRVRPRAGGGAGEAVG